jgi:hypothetical protein
MRVIRACASVGPKAVMPTKADAVSAVVNESIAAVLRARGADPIQNVIGILLRRRAKLQRPKTNAKGCAGASCRKFWALSTQPCTRNLDSGFAQERAPPEGQCVSHIAIEVIGVSN